MDNEAANKEFYEILHWANEEERKRVTELKSRGEWVDSLDGNDGLLDDIREERNRKIYALADKYGIKAKK